MNQETVAHELRPCMKKYKEVRIELSTAVKALFILAKYQDSPRAHFAVFSLLEWGQVIGLLVGSQLNEFLNDINKRHAFHFGVWAHHEPVTFLREYKIRTPTKSGGIRGVYGRDGTVEGCSGRSMRGTGG